VFKGPTKDDVGPHGSVLVSVRRTDLVVVLRAARQLHATPLISAEFHTVLGSAITSVLAVLEPSGDTSKGLFVDRPRPEII
jgi:hypothetical protein